VEPRKEEEKEGSSKIRTIGRDCKTKPTYNVNELSTLCISRCTPLPKKGKYGIQATRLILGRYLVRNSAEAPFTLPSFVVFRSFYSNDGEKFERL
jgi:hypothetical protein